MKLFINTIILLLALLPFSCDKFIEVNPQDSIDDATAVVDETSANNAIRGVYRALAADNYYGLSFQSIGYLSGDNVQWTGSQSIVQQFIDHNVRADNATVASIWTGIYTTINRANTVLARVPAITETGFTEAERNQLLGEAYFIRALAYFDLARTWGGVQIVLTPTQSVEEKAGISRSSLEETYAQVLRDLDAAEPLLPETTNRYRATRKTVWALKARYYLYQRDWTNAEAYATKLIADNQYRLLKPYNAWFANNVVATEESVLELAYSPTTTNGHRGQWQPPANAGTRQWAPNSTLVTLLNTPSTGGGRSALIAKTAAGLWYGNLYYRSPATDPAYLFRIAEAYLIRAEARAQQDKITDGLADLNAVRDRAGLTPDASTTKEDLLLAIENERRLEFALEPHRWFDLVRTGRADEVLNVTDPNRYVLPIPAGELLVDRALTQNQGY